MSSSTLRIASLILLLCAGSSTAKPPVAPVPGGEIERFMTQAIVKAIQPAQTIVLADFKEPDGTVITRIIRSSGDRKLWERWNNGMFPRGPILIYERAGDNIGDATGIISSTGYYSLDETKRFIVLDSKDVNSGKKEEILIPLADVLKALKEP